MGMSSLIFVKCDCGMFFGTGDHPSSDTTLRTIQGKHLNSWIVYSAFKNGNWKRGYAKLCEMFNMLFSMSLSTWYDHEEVLSKAH